MRVLPVIDLKGGIVVHAKRGDRANYTAIETPLAPGTSQPADIARALLNLSPNFDSLYIADIDAIVGGKSDPKRETITELSESLPGVCILLDDGASSPADVEQLVSHPSIIPVIGTESLRSLADFHAVTHALPSGFALSLDWQADAPQGPGEIFEAPQLWPQTIIAMTLDRVGAKAGPDFARLAMIKAVAGHREVLAAGGVRDANDLRALRANGCGALVATALHDGSISPTELASLQDPGSS